MRKQKKSKLLDGIKEGLLKGMNEHFSVADVNLFCNNLLGKSAAFLPKHCKGNPGNYSVFFERKEKGRYSLIK